MSKKFDDEIKNIASFVGDRALLRRTVCGKPHKTKENAERAARLARSWGWADVEIEERQYYFVVTGYDLGKTPAEGRTGISNPIKGRYRWPSK